MKKIVKKGFAVLTCTAMAAGVLLTGCGQKTSSDDKNDSSAKKETSDTAEKQYPKGTGSSSQLQDVTLNEVAHSIFYAPMYVAIENKYFEEEGINLDLVTGFGADKTMTAVLSGDADIGFMGPETTVYSANEGASDLVVNFAQLTQRAGNFLVAREKMPDFQWSNLKGKDVLGGRAGGVHTSM